MRNAHEVHTIFPKGVNGHVVIVGDISGTILSYQRVPISTLNSPDIDSTSRVELGDVQGTSVTLFFQNCCSAQRNTTVANRKLL